MTRKISRRIVLRGIGGAALALPLLESLPLARALGQSRATDTTFAIFFRQANGVACEQNSALSDAREPERFWPTQPGALTEAALAGRALEELASYRDRLLVVGNVVMNDYDYGDGHARGALQGLTARGPTVAGAAGASEADGESLDHRIGAALNPDGRDSLFLYAGASGGWLGGPCISYRGPGQRRAAFQSPKSAYEAVSGTGAGSELSADAAMQLQNRQKSINDLVRAQMQRLLGHPRLGESDRRKLTLHFEAVRELELQLGCGLDDARQQMLDGAEAFYDSIDGDEVWRTTRLHMDIAAMAVACGYTRSVAIQVGNGNDGSNRYRDPDTGQLMENFHYVSHRRQSHDDSGAVIAGSDVLHHKVDRQFAQAFEYLLERLSLYAMPDGKSLLEHGVAVWYNDLGDGPAHSPVNTPFVIGGSANGFLKQGEYIRVSGSGPNHNRMLNTIGSAVGLRNASGGLLDEFGDPDQPRGVLPELIA